VFPSCHFPSTTQGVVVLQEVAADVRI